jgi:hypothetical protein
MITPMNPKNLCLAVLIAAAALVIAQEEPAAPTADPVPAKTGTTTPADDAPLAFPPLEHYARLWENSLFTTRSLPPPETENKGPIFTDQLVLAGVYEVDGAMAVVLLDKTTSLISEARIGSENENGIKIVRVNPGVTPDKTRVQLQKADQVGWITFADVAAPPSEPAPNAVIPTRPGAPNPRGVSPANQPAIAPPLPPPQAVAPATPDAVPSPLDDLPLPPQ